MINSFFYVFLKQCNGQGGIMTERLPDADGTPAGAAFKMVNELGITKEFELDAGGLF